MSSAVQSLRWAGAARDGQLLGSTIGHLLNLFILNLPCSLGSFFARVNANKQDCLCLVNPDASEASLRIV